MNNYFEEKFVKVCEGEKLREMLLNTYEESVKIMQEKSVEFKNLEIVDDFYTKTVDKLCCIGEIFIGDSLNYIRGLYAASEYFYSTIHDFDDIIAVLGWNLVRLVYTIIYVYNIHYKSFTYTKYTILTNREE